MYVRMYVYMLVGKDCKSRNLSVYKMHVRIFNSIGISLGMHEYIT